LFPDFSELVAAAFAVILGIFLLAVLGLQCPELFAGVFPGKLAGFDGLSDFFPDFSELVVAAFFFTLGFTFSLGLSLVATLTAILGVFLLTTLAPGRFPGFLGRQASFVMLDGFFESCIGILLGDFAFLDKPVVLLLLFSKPPPAL
jgi:hypothetical protein